MTCHIGDCIEVMPMMAADSIDACVTDPPYGLSFMGRKWDYDVPSVAIWREVLRVLKPGAYLLVFGGTRTYHRMVCAIEDAGFEIRDQIQWIYASGFPKSLDVSKAIDKAAGARGHDGSRFNAAGVGLSNGGCKFRSDHPEYVKPQAITDAARQWEGWGTALKPAHEPIVVARKPLIGTVAENVRVHGTGGLNIDGCRVASECSTRRENNGGTGDIAQWRTGARPSITGSELGRWPSNAIHDGSDEVVALFPETTSGTLTRVNRRGWTSEPSDAGKVFDREGDAGTAARFFYCAKADRADRNEGCEALDKVAAPDFDERPSGDFAERMNRERPPVLKQNIHPTVKPTDLMRYLCRLVTPPGGTVLDPFAGSGSTGKAAILEGFDCVLIEREAEYVEIIKARMAWARQEYAAENAQQGLVFA